MRNRLCVLVCLVMLGVFSGLASGSVVVRVDGELLRTDPSPVLRDGRVFVPVTAFRKLGLAVEVQSWTRVRVGWPDSDVIVPFEAGKDYFLGEPVYGPRQVIKLPGTPFMSDGTLMVPLSALLKQELTWDEAANTVHVRYDPRWLNWRLERNDELIRARPDWYSTPLVGKSAERLPVRVIERARRLESAGRWEEAVGLLRTLIERHPYDWQSTRVVPEWKAYPVLGEILINRLPHSGEGHLYLGISNAMNGSYEGAENQFLTGAELSPSNAELQCALGWVLLRKEGGPSSATKTPDMLERALEYFEKALQWDPQHRKALISAGYANMQLAWMVNLRGGYTDESNAEARPYLEKAVGYFERLINVIGPNRVYERYVREMRTRLTETAPGSSDRGL